MNKENLIMFFQQRVEDIAELRKENQRTSSLNFKKWKERTSGALLRMESSYEKKFNKILYYPQIFISGYDDIHREIETYNSGLDHALAILEAVIEDLETWGFDRKDETKSNSLNHEGITLNLTMTQQQAQQISQTISLENYAPSVQRRVEQLFEELSKESKNKSKIKEIIKWLLDKGFDALVAILLAKSNMA